MSRFSIRRIRIELIARRVCYLGLLLATEIFRQTDVVKSLIIHSRSARLHQMSHNVC